MNEHDDFDEEATQEERIWQRSYDIVHLELTRSETAQLLIHMGFRKELIDAVYPYDPANHEKELVEKEEFDAACRSINPHGPAFEEFKKFAALPPDEIRKFLDGLKEQSSKPRSDVELMFEDALLKLATKLAKAEQFGTQHSRDDCMLAMMNAWDSEQAKSAPRKRV